MNRVLKIALPFCLFAAFAYAQVNVTTYHNDTARTGQNTSETVLTPALLTSSQFGRLFSQPVDGQIYAQPLVVSGVKINGVQHQVVYVATENDSVYAFDGHTNQGANASPLWHTSFINPSAGITTVNSNGDIFCGDLVPQVGITGTPVINAATGTLYVVANTKENGVFYQRLHALDITTGLEKFGGPVVIQASVPGTGAASVNGVVSFDPLQENQRSALLLENGNVYIGWASHCDTDPYHGWIMSYNAQTLAQTGVWNSSPNGTRSGVWQGGAGLAGDGVTVFFATGNGTADTMHDVGDSVVQLGLGTSGLVELDDFTAFNQASLSDSDSDLGSGGVLLLPTLTGQTVSELAVAVGKEGRVYLLNRQNLGGFHSSGDEIVQELPGAVAGVWGTEAYWNNNVYFGGSGDNIKAFSFNAGGTGLLSTTPTSESPEGFSFPGPTVSVSSNGTTNGIVWAIETDAYTSSGNAILHAYDATNLATELWNSSQQPPRDIPGPAVKFTVPTVANGHVYVGTSTQLSVYGQTPPPAATPVLSLVSGVYSAAQSVTITDATSNAVIYYTTNGTTPTATSTVYSTAIPVTKDMTLRAIAVAPNVAQSPVANAIYSIQTFVGNGPNYRTGFSGQGMTLNGTSTYQGTALQLTDGNGGEAASAWFNTPINATNFVSDFSFQLTNANADGFTFCVQNAGLNALGLSGGSLGYQNIGTSVAIKFDLYNNAGEGTNSTGIFTDGAAPFVPAIDLTSSGINLHSGLVYNVRISYANSSMLLQIIDPNTNTSFFQTTFPIDIPTTVGGNTVLVGFTGGTGGETAIQQILTWNVASPVN
jgi:hypothetical protein